MQAVTHMRWSYATSQTGALFVLVIRLRAERFSFRIPTGVIHFSLLSGARHAHGLFSPDVNSSWPKFHHSPLTSAVVKNEWSFTFASPCAFMPWCTGRTLPFYRTIYWVRWVQFTSSHADYLSFILMLSSFVRLGSLALTFPDQIFVYMFHPPHTFQYACLTSACNPNLRNGMPVQQRRHGVRWTQ